MKINASSLDAAMRRYPRANRERVRAWLEAMPEPQVSMERKRAAVRKLIELRAAKAA